MNNRAKEIQFKEDYTQEDWEKDWPLMDILLQLLPKEEVKDLQDTWINIINNPQMDTKGKDQAIVVTMAAYINPYTLSKVPKIKLMKILAALGKFQAKTKLGLQ